MDQRYCITSENKTELNQHLKISKHCHLDSQNRSQLLALWNDEYPEKLAHNSLTLFDEYINNLNRLTHWFLTSEEEVILGWTFTFERDNQRWFVIILSEKIQRQGFGLKMLNQLKESENELNGWVIDHNNDLKKNKQVYHSPLAFYEKCGFDTLVNERLELEHISAVKIRWTKKNYSTL